jgi:hypothetical protein
MAEVMFDGRFASGIDKSNPSSLQIEPELGDTNPQITDNKVDLPLPD